MGREKTRSRAEELAAVVRMHIVGYLVVNVGRCNGCREIPSNPPLSKGGMGGFGVPMQCHSCAESAGNELGRQIEEDLVKRLGGFRVSIPTLAALERREKRRLIKRQFNGANQTELALNFGVSRKTVYNILKEEE